MSFKLTEQQQRIVKHPSGHARVLAVAGSGKTFTMGHRIKYLIKERGVSPKKIRVLMFNSLAKKQFVERLLELDFSNSELPYVATFHGFAFQFIQHLKNKSMIPKKKFWTGDDEEKATILIHKTMEELMKEKTIPAPESIEESLDIKEIKEAISRYKGALIPPVRAGHHFNKFIPIIYNRYEQKRSELNALTFDDFIPTVINILENNEQLRNIWSEKADYLIVDEYQDVNYGQQKLIEVLAGNKAEVMVVGDDDQTIYEWRGARPNYIIRDFMSAFDNKPHSTYKLSYSFRFGPMIAQTAQNTILHNTNRVEKELIAFNPKIESYLRFYKGGEGSSTEWHKQMTQELIRLVKGQNVLPEKIWKMTLAGMTAPAIAQELGVKFALVNSAVRRGRENGVVPRRKRKNPLKHGTKNHMRLGSISYIIKQLSEEQLDWLIINAHKCECETVSEYILEIVRDAFFEEVEVNKNEQA